MKKRKAVKSSVLSRTLIITVIAAILAVCALVCVVILKKEHSVWITKAEAAKLIAGACASQEEWSAMNDYDEWYRGYAGFVDSRGYFTVEHPQDIMRLEDVKSFLDKSEISYEDSGLDCSGNDSKKIKKNDFINAYIRILDKLDNGNLVSSVRTVVAGTPSNMGDAKAWQAYTDDGIYHFAGLALDYALDRSAMLLVRDREILCVQKIEKNAQYRNAWVVSGKGSALNVYVGGVKREYRVKTLTQDISGVMADIILEDGKVTAVNTKSDTISGKVLAAAADYIEIDNYGRVPLDEHYRIYRTYGGLEMKDYQDIIVGYDLQKFIVADGKICGAEISKPLNADKVRVLIKTDGFAGLYHDSIEITADTSFVIHYGDKESNAEKHAANDRVTFTGDCAYLAAGRVKIEAEEDAQIKVLSVKRAYGNPQYEGMVEIASAEDGLVLINEIAIEDYLKRVVPSEMPVSYGVEALKVQAVCARSYVYKELGNNNYAWLGAHIDDSTQYQVYNNVQESSAANQAIAQTDGQIITYEGSPVQTYYYSTSCGVTTDVSLWGSDTENYPYFVSKAVGRDSVDIDLTDEDNFRRFIKNIRSGDYDRNYDLYRWELNATVRQLSDSFNSRLASRMAAMPGKILVKNADGSYVQQKIGSIGDIQNIAVTQRVAGGAAVTAVVTGSSATVQINGENNIRYMFGVSDVPLVTVNGNMRNMSSLPSAFCIFEPIYDKGALSSFKITGGGYGHGIGMSQNAVYTMTVQGMSYSEILEFFYPGTQIG